jgi:molybdopterin converting factor small subunit
LLAWLFRRRAFSGSIDMKVTVKLFASFQTGRFERELREYPEPTSIGTVVRELNIPEEEVGILLLNAVHADLQQPLKDGDLLAIFPLVGGG